MNNINEKNKIFDKFKIKKNININDLDLNFNSNKNIINKLQHKKININNNLPKNKFFPNHNKISNEQLCKKEIDNNDEYFKNESCNDTMCLYYSIFITYFVKFIDYYLNSELYFSSTEENMVLDENKFINIQDRIIQVNKQICIIDYIMNILLIKFSYDININNNLIRYKCYTDKYNCKIDDILNSIDKSNIIYKKFFEDNTTFNIDIKIIIDMLKYINNIRNDDEEIIKINDNNFKLINENSNIIESFIKFNNECMYNTKNIKYLFTNSESLSINYFDKLIYIYNILDKKYNIKNDNNIVDNKCNIEEYNIIETFINKIYNPEEKNIFTIMIYSYTSFIKLYYIFHIFLLNDKKLNNNIIINKNLLTDIPDIVKNTLTNKNFYYNIYDIIKNNISISYDNFIIELNQSPIQCIFKYTYIIIDYINLNITDLNQGLRKQLLIEISKILDLIWKIYGEDFFNNFKKKIQNILFKKEGGNLYTYKSKYKKYKLKYLNLKYL